MLQHRGSGTPASRREALLAALVLVTVWLIPTDAQASGTPVYPTLRAGDERQVPLSAVRPVRVSLASDHDRGQRIPLGFFWRMSRE